MFPYTMLFPAPIYSNCYEDVSCPHDDELFTCISTAYRSMGSISRLLVFRGRRIYTSFSSIRLPQTPCPIRLPSRNSSSTNGRHCMKLFSFPPSWILFKRASIYLYVFWTPEIVNTVHIHVGCLDGLDHHY